MPPCNYSSRTLKCEMTEPIRDMPYPPFTLKASEDADALSHLFDGKVLSAPGETPYLARTMGH